jgi:hypothetical protein
MPQPVPRVPLNIRIPSDLLQALKERAAQEGTTVTELLIRGAGALLGLPAAKARKTTIEARVQALEEKVKEIERKDATDSV